MVDNFSAIALSFDKPARLSTDEIWDHVSELSKEANCSEVFGEVMMAALGFPRLCKWSQDHRQMYVPLSYNATLLLGETLFIEGTLVPAGNMAWPGPPQLNSTLFTRQDFVISGTDLSANARVTRSCSWLYFTSQNLTGDAGRPFRANWTFGPQTPEPMRTSLEEVLVNATQLDLLELVISPAQFNAAVDAVAQQVGEMDIMRLEIVVTISNWLGESTSDSASTWVQLDQAPQVVPVGDTNVQIYNREEVEYNMQTELREDFTCSDASRYNRRIAVDWEYSGSNTSGWVKLTDVPGLVDTAFSPFTLGFAAFSFEPDSYHYFRATAYFQGLDPSIVENTQVLLYGLYVKPRERPVALVTGPSETSVNCGFVMSAADSLDPSLPPTEPTSFRYRWSCQTDAQDEVCKLLDSSMAEFRIPGAILQEGLYTFTALVWRSFETEAEAASASITVLLSASAPPPVVITTPWLNGSGVSTEMGWSTGPMANIIGSSTCPIPPVSDFRWTLVSSAGVILSVYVPEGSWNETYASLTLSSSTFDGSQLTVGELYQYVLMLGLQDNTITLLDGNVVGSLTSAEAAGAFIVRSSPFLADGPPRDGQVVADPPEGFAVETKFKLNALDWVDESVSELQYAFYQFTQEQLNSLTAPWDLPAAVTALEWDNSSSSSYWVNLGGVLLQDWSKSASCETILPIGDLITILRVRDHFGAMAVVGVQGPTVTAPIGGVEPALATAALGSAVALNEANSILNAVAAVSSVSVAGSAEESRAVVSASMTALEAAADLAPPDSSTLQKVGGVIAAALSSGSAGTQDKSTLSRASAVLDTVLSTASAATAVVDEDAGNAMLGSLLTITTANSDGGGDAAASASVTAKALNLVSKLGQVMMNSLPANGTQAITSVDASGRGTESRLAKVSAADAARSGLSSPGANVPSAALGGSRRLQECNDVGLQFTHWFASNPYSWANASFGINSEIANNATVSVLELSRCGVVVDFGSSVEVTVALPERDAQVDETPTCVIFDQGAQEWVRDNISLTSANRETMTATCSTTSSGTYAVYYRHTPLVEQQSISTLVAVAFTIPVVLVASAFAGGAIYLMRKRAIDQRRRKNKAKVYPETEKDESLKEVVTEEPPGGDTDAGTEDEGVVSSQPVIAFEEGKNSAALHALRRHSYGEVPHPPLPSLGSDHERPHLELEQGLPASPIQGWPSPVRPSSKQSSSATEPVHVSPVRVIHRSRSQSREHSTEINWNASLPGSVPGEMPVHTQARRSRSREPAANVRVVRKSQDSTNGLLRAAALAAADSALRPPSASTAVHSEVEPLEPEPIKRVVGTRVDPKAPRVHAAARVVASKRSSSGGSTSPVKVTARRTSSESRATQVVQHSRQGSHMSTAAGSTAASAAAGSAADTAATLPSVRVVARKVRPSNSTSRECIAKVRQADALSPIHSPAQSPTNRTLPTLLDQSPNSTLQSALSHSTLT